jgi:hypothetical protein
MFFICNEDITEKGNRNIGVLVVLSFHEHNVDALLLEESSE